MPAEIAQFFASYISGYDMFSAKKVATHYSVPSVVLDSGGVETFTDEESLEAKMAVYCKGFKQSGYKKAIFECVQYCALGERACFVDLQWHIELAERVLEYRTAYVLHRTDGGWKINNATVFGY